MNEPTTDELLERLVDASAAVAHAEGIYSAGARRELDDALAAVKASMPSVAPAEAAPVGVDVIESRMEDKLAEVLGVQRYPQFAALGFDELLEIVRERIISPAKADTDAKRLLSDMASASFGCSGQPPPAREVMQSERGLPAKSGARETDLCYCFSWRIAMKCRHLVISGEAYRNGEPAGVFLCNWPASKLWPLTPAWVDRSIGGGLMIDHKTECPACPCFERLEATND